MDIKKTGLSLRKAVDAYNNGLPPERWISRSKMAKALSEQGHNRIMTSFGEGMFGLSDYLI